MEEPKGLSGVVLQRWGELGERWAECGFGHEERWEWGNFTREKRKSKGEVRAGAGLEVRNVPDASRSWAQPGEVLGTSVPASKRGPEVNPAASIIGPLESNLPCASPP